MTNSKGFQRSGRANPCLCALEWALAGRRAMVSRNCESTQRISAVCAHTSSHWAVEGAKCTDGRADKLHTSVAHLCGSEIGEPRRRPLASVSLRTHPPNCTTRTSARPAPCGALRSGISAGGARGGWPGSCVRRVVGVSSCYPVVAVSGWSGTVRRTRRHWSTPNKRWARWSAGENWCSTAESGTTSGRSTSYVLPSCAMVADPLASTFLSQSALSPYGSAITNPSSSAPPRPASNRNGRMSVRRGGPPRRTCPAHQPT